MNDHWQDNLRNRMGQHKESAPEGLWEGIDHLLSERHTDGGVPMKRRRLVRSLYIGAISAAAVVAILLLLVLPYTTSKDQEGVHIAEGSSPHTLSQEQQLNKEQLLQPEQHLVETIKTNNKHLFAEKGNQDATSRPSSERSISESFNANRQEEIVTLTADGEMQQVDREAEARKQEESTEIIARQETTEHLYASASLISTRKRSKWQTNLSVSNLPSGTSESYSGYGTFAVAEAVDNQYHFMSNYSREQAYTEVKHHQPVTFGLTVRYNLNSRWSLSSGLTYSLLNSELYSSGVGNYYYDDHQTLHYIGIPLNLGYTFWQKNRLSSYLTTGALVEKNIAGKLTSKYYLDNQLEVTTTEKVRAKELQWSVNAAMGLGYQLSNTIGLYAEPGISYYFNNGSQLETIYKEDPLHFNLRLGLRFTFNN